MDTYLSPQLTFDCLPLPYYIPHRVGYRVLYYDNSIYGWGVGGGGFIAPPMVSSFIHAYRVVAGWLVSWLASRHSRVCIV